MAEIALGWLGWTEQEAMAADVNAIAVGYQGRRDLLESVFGRSEEETPPEELPVLTQEGFAGLFNRR